MRNILIKLAYVVPAVIVIGVVNNIFEINRQGIFVLGFFLGAMYELLSNELEKKG